MNIRLVILTVCICSTLLPAGDSSSKKKENSKVERGLQISPVPVKTDKLNRTAIGMGSYLVNAASSCANCHTCPTFVPALENGKNKQMNAQNYMAGGVPFPVRSEDGGTATSDLRSANLTPGQHGLPGGLTFVQFKAALTEGHRTLTEAYEQFPAPSEAYAGQISVMPWRIYRNFQTADLEAIYEYLKAIPPAKPGSCSGPGE